MMCANSGDMRKKNVILSGLFLTVNCGNRHRISNKTRKIIRILKNILFFYIKKDYNDNRNKGGIPMRTGALTGDTTNLTMYFVLAILAFFILLIILLLKRRKDKDEDQ